MMDHQHMTPAQLAVSLRNDVIRELEAAGRSPDPVLVNELTRVAAQFAVARGLRDALRGIANAAGAANRD